MSGFNVLHDDEIDDFWAAVKQYGFQEKDFELKQISDPTRGSGLQAVTGSVTVRCKVSGIEKTYAAGHGSSWPAQFHDDLAHGVFGRRSA